MNNNSKAISYFLFACIFYCAIVMTFVLIRDDRGSLTSQSIQKVYKSVVGIHVIQSVEERYDFQSFWDDYIVEKAVENMGSGLVLSEDGYIVTNYHVIEKASKIFIKTYNGLQYEVDLNNVYVDKLTDIAVIKINVEDRLYIPNIGDSESLVVGEDVIALGNPLGLFNASNKLTATKGIISALDVSFGFNKSSGSVYQDMIQTDASINLGNSGGPLMNLHGQIIGLNTFVISGSDSRGSIGLNFAIPINRVISIYSDLRDKGFVDRQFNTGIKVREIDQVLSQYLRLNSADGMLVVDVEKKSSGENAGIEIGDIILEVNKVKIKTLNDIERVINEDLLKTGDNLELKILRNNSLYELNLSLDKGEF